MSRPAPRPKVVLPHRENMLHRLRRLDSRPFLEEKLFPRLLELAGQRMNGHDVADKVTEAFIEFVDDLRPKEKKALMMRMPHFADALIDDPEVRRDAAEYFAEAEQALLWL